MKLSIITICYNDKAGFEKTAKSVIAQTYKDFEWIIVDGGSTDGSAELIDDTVNTLTANPLTANLVGYHVSEKDKGIYNAMNKGIRQAQGEYCLFLNSGDCFCSPKSLQRAMKKDWAADLVCFDIFCGGKGYLEAPDTLPIQRLLWGNINHQATFIKRALFDKGLYKEEYKINADWEFWFRNILTGECTYQAIHIPLVDYDLTGVSSTQNDERKAEHTSVQEQYIKPDMLKLLKYDTKDFSQLINALYMPAPEKKLFIFLEKSLDFLFSRVWGGLHARWQWLRYSGKC